MGGKAFSELGEDAFPRIPPQIYQALKEQQSSRLKELYELVETPREAPEKPDHGDVDFIVHGPRRESVTHEDVKRALGAEHCIPAEGFRTSNYAIAHGPEGRYYQVDVHVCEDRAEWDAIVFFHGYGDLGMILGLVARAQGLALGTKGLKIVAPQADETHPASFHLVSSFPEILPFFGLSMGEWQRGFSTVHEVFEWVRSSRLYDPRRMSDPRKRENSRKDRAMYQSFIEYSRNLITSGSYDTSRPAPAPEEVVQEALVYFGKKEEYDHIGETNRTRLQLKKKFTGTRVIEWTGLYGMPVRLVMNGVRERLSEAEIIQTDDEVLRAITLEVQKDLGLVASEHREPTSAVD